MSARAACGRRPLAGAAQSSAPAIASIQVSASRSDGESAAIGALTFGLQPSTAMMCLKLSGNMLMGSGPVADFRLVQDGLATMRLPFYEGLNSNNAAVVDFVRSLQSPNTPTTPTGIASNTVGSGGGGFLGGDDCSTP